MSNMQHQSHQQEKRTGSDRRREARPQRNGVERRKQPERRQTSVVEISYFEWASHFVKFHGRPRAEKPQDSGAEAPETAARR